MQALASLFLTILNMSITGAVVIAVVAALRWPLRHMPKRIRYMLWLLVAFRLICPVTFTAGFSVLGGLPVAAGGNTIAYVAPQPSADNTVQEAPQRALPEPSQTQEAEKTVTPLPPESIAALVWLCGLSGLLISGVVSYARLKHRLAAAVRVEPGVYESDAIASPFVCGVLRPRIYLPIGLVGEERAFILCHERMHVRRHDALIRLAAYIVRCVHWFNPLVWLAFTLMSSDMEQSCDERVLGEAGFDRKAYSHTLLRYAMSGAHLSAGPLAFGESGVKERIRNILHDRKPAFWLVVAAVIVCIAVGAICLANPAAQPTEDDYAQQLYESRTPYIGNNAAVGALLDTLRLPEGIYVESFQLQTAQPPYQLTIHYGYQGDIPKAHSNFEGDYFYNSALLFSLIDNADIIRHVGHWSNPDITANYFDYTHTREDAEEYLGIALKDYGQSAQDLERLMRLLPDKTDSYIVRQPAPTMGASPEQQSAHASVYAMGDTIFADLDGDGKDEEIYYGTDDLRVNGQSYKAEISELDRNAPSGDVFLVTDIDAADAQRELALRADGHSADPETFFYTWTQGRLVALGSIPCHTDDLDTSFDGRGKLFGALRLSVLQTWWADAAWVLAGGKITPVPQTVYRTGDVPVVLKVSLPVYKAMGDAEPQGTLPPQAVTLTATDNQAWCALRGADGTEGWFRVQAFNWLPDIGMSADEAFDGMSMAD